MNAPRAGWREPMVWLMVGIPLVTIAAGLLTLRIAGGGHALDAAPEAVKRTAQTQTTDLAADERAARLGLAADIEFAGDGAIVLGSPALSEVVTADGSLLLRLVHPTDAADDLIVILERDGDHWRGQANMDGHTAWGLRLGDASGLWRLVAKLTPGQRRARLEPALARR